MKKKNSPSMLPPMLSKTTKICPQFSDSLINHSGTYSSTHQQKTRQNDSLIRHKQLLEMKAQNFLRKIKNYDDPSMIFALNDAIYEQKNKIDLSFQSKAHKENKTFHYRKDARNQSCHRSPKHQNQTLLQLKNKMSGKSNTMLPANLKPFQSYPKKQERIKAQQLIDWVDNKLAAITASPQEISLDSVVEYNQSIVNFGLGQIIDTIKKRCKQEGQALQYIWTNSFRFFESVMNIFVSQIKAKEEELIKNEKELEKIYQQNLDYLKRQNAQVEKQSNSLYEKMRKVILWNRKIRKERNKLDTKLRVSDYRLATYSSALQQAVSMLLVYENQPDCNALAKKILSKLYRSKIHKKNRVQEKQSQTHVNEKTKEFVRRWLNKFSFTQDDKVEEAVTLTNQEKLQLLKKSDQEERDKIDIYDFFQTFNRGVQTISETVSIGLQYEFKQEVKQTKNVGIGTKKVYTMNVGIQTVSVKKEEGFNSKQNKREANIKPKKGQRVAKNHQTSPPALANKKKIKNGFKKSNRGIDFKTEDHLSDSIREQTGINENDAEDQPSRFNEDGSMDKDSQHKNEADMIVDDFNEWSETEMKNKSFNNISQFMPGSQLMVSSHFLGSPQKFHINLKIDRAYSTKNCESYLPNSIVQSDKKLEIYKNKPLLKKKFEEIYETQMKEQIQNNKQGIIRQVIRKRSFYKRQNKNGETRENQRIEHLYKFYRQRYTAKFINKSLYNQNDSEVLDYIMSLHRNSPTLANITKLKNYTQSVHIMSALSNTINKNMPIPKNKHFINLSVTSITKIISHVLYDLLRKIKADREHIYLDSEKVYYPLSNILIEKMNNKYGLKDIAEKKMKDFLSKISSFAKVNERVGLFYRLLGISEDQNEKIGGDELLIYLKSIVYFDINKIVTVVNINKDFSIDRAVTTKQTVTQQLPELVKQFFPESLAKKTIDKVHKYFETYQHCSQIQIEKIAQLLIDQFQRQKMKVYGDYQKIYKKCSSNFYLNLYKLLEILGKLGEEKFSLQFPASKSKKFFQQSYRSTDIIEEEYGKSLTEQKFINLCFKYEFPSSVVLQSTVSSLNRVFDACLDPKHCSDKEKLDVIKKIEKLNKIRDLDPYSLEPSTKEDLEWKCAKIVYEVVEINTNEALGWLESIRKGYTKLTNKKNLA